MSASSPSVDALEKLAAQVGGDWKDAKAYYDGAEEAMENQWLGFVWPIINDCDLEVCVDLAAGHGRNSAMLLGRPECKKLYCVDINQENIDFCTARFAGDPRVVCLKNNGVTISEIAAQSVTMFYSFDAMVHFDSDIVRSYLSEIARVLEPKCGRAFLHHSNYSGNPGGNLHDNPHWRNFMTAELMEHYAVKEGFATEKQMKLDWGGDGSYIDCLTLLRKAG